MGSDRLNGAVGGEEEVVEVCVLVLIGAAVAVWSGERSGCCWRLEGLGEMDVRG